MPANGFEKSFYEQLINQTYAEHGVVSCTARVLGSCRVQALLGASSQLIAIGWVVSLRRVLRLEGQQFGQPPERDLDPIGTVIQFVAQFVTGLLQGEQFQ